MPENDPRIAALAEALVPLLPQHKEGSGGYPHQSSHRTWTVYDWMTPEALAAAILAALPPDWCGHIGVEEAIAQGQRLLGIEHLARLEAESAIEACHRGLDRRDAEIARLRPIERAARQWAESDSWENEAVLRAALEANR